MMAAACGVGDVIVDPGATATVVGSMWLATHVAALSEDVRATVLNEAASVTSRFGVARMTRAERY